MKTLYVTDLDGTLLRSDTRLSAYTVETINAMVAKGMFFTYATARSEQSAQRVCQGLDMRIPVIVYNGARIVRPEDGGVLLSLSFDAQMRQHTAAYLSGLDIDPLVYAFVDGVQRVSWLEGRENEGIRYYLEPARRGSEAAPCPIGAGSCMRAMCFIVPVWAIKRSWNRSMRIFMPTHGLPA